MRTDIEFEFTLYEVGYFTVVPLIMPEDPTLRYEFIGEPTESGLDLAEFEKELPKRQFPKARVFKFYVIVEGKRRSVSVPLPEWPSGAGDIRMGRVLTKLKIEIQRSRGQG